MKKFLLLIFLLPFAAFSQALSGTYIIGTGQPTPFNKLTTAVARINNVGVNGPVVFLLDDTNYNMSSGETFPLKMTQYAGSNTTNTLTIRPNVGKTVAITGNNTASWLGLPAVFQFEGADNIIIDGSNSPSGASKDLTINNANNVIYVSKSVIWISSINNNPATNISVQNTNVRFTNRNQETFLQMGIYAGNNSVDSNNGINNFHSSAPHSAIKVRNNVFTNVREAIYVMGASEVANQINNLQITGNTIGSTINAEKPLRSIYLLNVNNFDISTNNISGLISANNDAINGLEIESGSNFTVRNNTITDVQSTEWKTGHGVFLRGNIVNGIVTENKISNIKNTGPGLMRGMTIDIYPATSSNLVVSNNFISDVSANGTNEFSGIGLLVGNGRNIRIVNNSVSLTAAQPGNSAAFRVAAGNELDVRNNIFKNTLGSGTPNAFGIHSAVGPGSYTQLNYNDYVGTPLGAINGIHNTLASFKAASGKDQNSVNINPVFTSISDLHFANNTNAALDNLGTPIAGITTDIDGATRSTTTPDIGADEFSGAPVVTVPTISATAVNFTNVSSTGFTANWTSGNGTNRLVVIRQGSAVNMAPVDASTYTSNSVFGSGSQIGSGNYAVYGGSGSSVTITGLAPATSYHIAVYEFNGTAGSENYKASTPAQGNRLTLNALLGWQIASTNTLNTINFDTTVANVNNGAFAGNGFTTIPTAGQLNSDSWSAIGLSDGNSIFGASATTGGAAGGISTGNVTAGGTYAFQITPGNYSLGIQPDASNFAPGSVMLRFQNQTGAPITSLSVGYKVYVYNDQTGSSSFNFSHSANTDSFTAVPQMDLVSLAAADNAPSWKANYRVVTLTGLNIPASGYYYLNWSSAILSGTAFAEFALDDIVLSANPTSNYASFSGTADSFAVHGNTGLSGNTTVSQNLTLSAGKLSINSNTLTLAGSVTNTVSGGLRGGATSNLTLTGSVNRTLSFDQTTVGTTNLVNNFALNFADAKTITVDNPLAINGTLSVGLDQILNMGNNALSGNLTTATINGILRTQNTSILPIPSGKTWAGNGTVVYNAATAQKIVSGVYNSLLVSTPLGGVATGDVTVNGILNLPVANPTDFAGALDMGTYTLLMGSVGTNVGVGDVTGIVRRNTILPNVLYTFGHEHTSIIYPAIGTLPSTMSLKIEIGTVPTWKPGAIKRIYDLIQVGAVNTKAVIKSHYLDSELNGNLESKLVDWAYNSTTTPVILIEQGRSNFNTTDNFTELTNVNIGLYFRDSFGLVMLTLDESAAPVLTWTGNLTTSWTTAENWYPVASPSDDTAVIIPDATTTAHDPEFNPENPIKSITINAGAIVNAPSQSSATIKGGAGAWINNGIFNAAVGSTVTFTNADATIAGATNFNNVIIAANATLRPLTGNVMKIANSLLVNGSILTGAIENTVEFTGTNQLIPAPMGSQLNAYHNITISGTGAILPSNLFVEGDLTINNAVNFTGKTVSIIGLSSSIRGSVSPTFDNLTINKAASEVSLLTDASVSGTLTLTAGNLNIGSHNLTLGANPVAGTFVTGTMIIADGSGELRRKFTGTGNYLFPIGEKTSNASYSPISVNVTAGTFSNAYVGVSVADANHPDNHSVNNYMTRYWKVSQSGISDALATVNATFIAGDAIGGFASLAAAQLTGTFDLQTNPWKKYQVLTGTTMSVVNATLAPTQPSYFTGIRGAAFSVNVSGSGSFCQNEEELLTAEPIGGDGPYSYLWNHDLGTQNTAIPETALAGAQNYEVSVVDSNGLRATGNASITIAPEALPGSLFSEDTICFGYSPSSIQLSGNSAPVQYWERSDEASFTKATLIQSTALQLSAADAGQLTATTFFRAAVSNGICPVRFTAPVQISVRSTTWDGTSWSDGAPNNKVSALITGDYSAAVNIDACSLTILNNATVTILETSNVTLNGAITVGSGNFTLNSNANLIQINDDANFGNITVKRNSSPLFRLDYTMWGSPVTGMQTLHNFSELTTNNRFYKYDTSTDLFSAIDPLTTSFSPGAGFLIRMPNNHIAFTQTAIGQSWLGSFNGIPTTGIVSVPLEISGQGYNMVANPYPSTIDADEFLDQNDAAIAGTIYLWRRKNNVPTGNEATNAYYATYTIAGGTSVEPPIASLPTVIPNGSIQVGQGFIVKSLAQPGSSAITFNNSMRMSDSNNQFFRSASASNRSRIWINAAGPQDSFSQTLLAYMNEASTGIDRGDGKYMNDGNFEFNSLIDENAYSIQARPLALLPSDVVPMHFRTPVAGSYTISIDHVDGLFTADQNIYLRDNLTGVVHDLKASAYVFASVVGTFDSRFEILFQSTLGTKENQNLSNSLVVYKEASQIVVNSGKLKMDSVKLFDLNGRLIYQKDNVDSTELKIPAPLNNQVLIIKATVGEQRIPVATKYLN